MKMRIQLSLAVGAVLLLMAPRSVLGQASVAEGVQLWSQNCGRCHNFRAAEERTDAQWAVIVSHMRARANLSKSTAQAILAFLQASNIQEASNGADRSVATREGSKENGSSGVSKSASPDDLARAEWVLLTRLLRP